MQHFSCRSVTYVLWMWGVPLRFVMDLEAFDRGWARFSRVVGWPGQGPAGIVIDAIGGEGERGRRNLFAVAFRHADALGIQDENW